MSVARRPDPAGDDACATPPVEDLQQRLGLDVDPALLRRALTHRSYAYENGGLPTNERLEFLGDAVLGLVVTDALYRRHPDEPEGRLAKMRAAVVNMRALAEVARSIGVGEHVLLGRGEESTGGRDKASILADTVEALLGAAYLSHGVGAAQDLVLRLVGPLLDSSSGLGAGLDWKTSLQELTSEAGLGVPEYRVEEEGPDHAKVFHASVVVDGVERGTGTGRSKKEAEQQAASTAWAALGGREQSGEEAAATPSSCAHEEGPAAVPAGGPGAAVPAGTAPR